MAASTLPASPASPASPFGPVACAARGVADRAWDVPARVVLPAALAVALLLSTQYLFQPFVWRNWPLDEVLLGWLDVVSSRALTALAIGVAVLAAGHVRTRRGGVRTALMAGAIVAGAAAGELLPLPFHDRAGSYDTQLALGRALQATVVGCSVAAMAALWRRSAAGRRALQAAELRASQVEQQAAQLRLQALRSRIEPHFLFNTLATVRRLHHTNPAQGTHLLDQFTAYLRWTLATEQANQTRLGEEVNLVQAYLGVVATRMSGRLALHWDVPDALRDCVVPPLSLATLAENAVKHGIASRPEGGAIEVRARALGHQLEVSVADTGVGFGESASGGSGIGLANIRARLATQYGQAASLRLEHNAPRGVVALMSLPLRRAAVAP
jgi:Histidine kinase